MIRSGGLVIAGSVGVGLMLPGFAANPLSSTDIANRFATGATIKATAIPGGASYELNLAADGLATMKVVRGDRSSRSGTWRVSKSGYCATWSPAPERCFTIVKNGKAYDVIDAAGKVVARWTT
jgi:hypothetical protein